MPMIIQLYATRSDEHRQFMVPKACAVFPLRPVTHSVSVVSILRVWFVFLHSSSSWCCMWLIFLPWPSWFVTRMPFHSANSPRVGCRQKGNITRIGEIPRPAAWEMLYITMSISYFPAWYSDRCEIDIDMCRRCMTSEYIECTDWQTSSSYKMSDPLPLMKRKHEVLTHVILTAILHVFVPPYSLCENCENYIYSKWHGNNTSV